MSHSSFRQLARLHHAPLWLAPRRCTVQQGLHWSCWGNRGFLRPAGHWRLTPSHPPSCDMHLRSLALQTPQTLDPGRKGRDPQRWEPAERTTISDNNPTDQMLSYKSSRFPHRFHQTVCWSTFLAELSAELWGDSEGGVRSVRRRSYNKTIIWH